jgi:tRNA G18 (ribose-2'-O)-methylase SpoU
LATHIESLHDSRLIDYQHLTRPAALTAQGLFVAEGRWVVQRLLAREHFIIRSVLVTPPALAALADDLEPRPDVHAYVVSQAVMDGIVGVNIHRGCLAIAERPVEKRLDAVSLSECTRLVVLEGVNNPDNVGGIFRSAAAFAVDLIVLGPACGDPLYRKAVRTSMAATLDVPYVNSGPWPAALEALRAAGFRVLALTPSPDAPPLESVATPDRLALLFGTEGTGLSPDAIAHADQRVRIRTTDRVDSLNVTVATSIALHHFAPGRT